MFQKLMIDFLENFFNELAINWYFTTLAVNKFPESSDRNRPTFFEDVYDRLILGYEIKVFLTI